MSCLQLFWPTQACTIPEATVTRNAVNSNKYTVRLPKEERLGSRLDAGIRIVVKDALCCPSISDTFFFRLKTDFVVANQRALEFVGSI